MGNKIDLTGQTFDKWTVIKEGMGRPTKTKYKKATWICKCECGVIKEVLRNNLTSNRTKSCGNCFPPLLHGSQRTKEYRAWECLKGRCHNPNNASYNNYGAKGITVCDEWVNSFETFLKDMGPAPKDKNVSIDRINEDKGYKASNCRWTVSKVVQAINRGTPSNNTSGVKGVGWDKTNQKWTANISINKKLINLGRFTNKEDAIRARKEAEKKYYRPLLLPGIKTWAQLLDLYKSY